MTLHKPKHLLTAFIRLRAQRDRFRGLRVRKQNALAAGRFEYPAGSDWDGHVVLAQTATHCVCLLLTAVECL